MEQTFFFNIVKSCFLLYLRNFEALLLQKVKIFTWMMSKKMYDKIFRAKKDFSAFCVAASWFCIHIQIRFLILNIKAENFSFRKKKPQKLFRSRKKVKLCKSCIKKHILKYESKIRYFLHWIFDDKSLLSLHSIFQQLFFTCVLYKYKY